MSFHEQSSAEFLQRRRQVPISVIFDASSKPPAIKKVA
jgi:hypothetical protein